jgi:hypothetical protein
LLKSGNESILRKVLGKTDVAHHSRETGDEPRRLDFPNCLNRAMYVRSRHSHDHNIFASMAQHRRAEPVSGLYFWAS